MTAKRQASNVRLTPLAKQDLGAKKITKQEVSTRIFELMKDIEKQLRRADAEALILGAEHRSNPVQQNLVVARVMLEAGDMALASELLS